MLQRMHPKRRKQLFHLKVNPYDGRTRASVNQKQVHTYWWEKTLHSLLLNERLPTPAADLPSNFFGCLPSFLRLQKR